MTVAELRRELAALPSDMLVLREYNVDGWEELWDVDRADVTRVRIRSSSSWTRDNSPAGGDALVLS